MQQMMQQTMADPQAMQQVQQMMSNPESMRQVQQMMNNPQAMQRAMQMMSGQHQGMQAGMPFGHGIDTQPAQTPVSGPTEDMLRARFAHLLPQLAAMGFTNETLCLRALQQQNGRLDAAIDMLLTSGDAVQ